MTGIKIRHPEVTVHMAGTDGNAFAVLGAVKNALAGAGVSEAEQASLDRGNRQGLPHAAPDLHALGGVS